MNTSINKTIKIAKNLPDCSFLGFGGGAISGEGGGYSFGATSEANAIKLITHIFERGVNLFDSAPIYGFGTSEKRIGKALKPYYSQSRENIILTSKSGVSWHNNKRVNMTNDPTITENMLNQSLKDLQTDYIDLYFIHWPDDRVDIRRPMEVLHKYFEKGMIRAIGLCNTHTSDLDKAREIAPISVVQSEYHLFQRQVEQDIFPYCREHNITFMSWGTLDKGILTGQYDLNANRDEYDCRRSAPWWKKSDVTKKVHLVEEIKSQLPTSISMTQLALAWQLTSPYAPGQIIPLCGTRTIEQFDQIYSYMSELAHETKFCGSGIFQNFSNDFWQPLLETAKKYQPDPR